MRKSAIFDNKRFRIYVPFRQYLELEKILTTKNIEYFIDFEMPNSVTDLARFYFKNEDKKIVDQILRENQIETTDDFFVPADYKRDQKAFKIYLIFFLFLLIGVFVFYLIYKLIS